MMRKLKQLNTCDIDNAQRILKVLTDSQLENIYCEVVELKKSYQLAYDRLENELNIRKSEKIERAFKN